MVDHRSRDEGWVDVSSENIFRSQSDQASDWQRMRGVREREQTRERPQQAERATTFSQFFSQLRHEGRILVQGIQQLFGRRAQVQARQSPTRY